MEALLQAHLAARRALGADRYPRTLELVGTLNGLGATGTFHIWRDGASERIDRTLGVRTRRLLRLVDSEQIQNEEGDVRTILGSTVPRSAAFAFVNSGRFAQEPSTDRLLGPGMTHDGRAVWKVRVQPPGGFALTVGLDATTSLIDEIVMAGSGGTSMVEYADDRVIDGALIPFEQTESNGNPMFDVVAHVTRALVDRPIDAAVFAPLLSPSIAAVKPVVVPLLVSRGHVFVRAQVAGQPMLFLLDSGSQGVFLAPDAAQRIGLHPTGTLQVNGGGKTLSHGVAALDAIAIGGATLPLKVVAVVDMSGVEYDGRTADGVLGDPLFAAAEVRIDPDAMTVTLARPGTLPVHGSELSVDPSDELPVVEGEIDRTPARLLIDTGNTEELLVFHDFIAAHPGLIEYAGAGRFAANRGIGGSSAAVPVMVDQLKLGPFELFNRYAAVILASRGAFSGSSEAGNVGWGSLQNFITTFDLADGTILLQKARRFDEGRFRAGPP